MGFGLDLSSFRFSGQVVCQRKADTGQGMVEGDRQLTLAFFLRDAAPCKEDVLLVGRTGRGGVREGNRSLPVAETVGQRTGTGRGLRHTHEDKNGR